MKFNNSTSKFENTVGIGLQHARYSFAFWAWPDSVGASGAGRVLSMDETGSPIALRMLSGPNRWQHLYTFSGGTGRWSISATLDRWNGVAVTHNRTDGANTPDMYSRIMDAEKGLIKRTVTADAPTTGTPSNTTTAGWCIGGNTSQANPFDGHICFFQFWSRILTHEELSRALQYPGSVREGLVMCFDLVDDFRDSGPRGHKGTPTDVVKGFMPPSVVPWRPRPIIGKAAGGALQTITLNSHAVRKLLGSPALHLNVNPAALARKAVPGSLTMVPGAVTVVPTGTFAKATAGTPVIVLSVDPSGTFAKASFGAVTLVPGAVTVTPTGTLAQGAFGTPLVAVAINPTSFTPRTALGSPTAVPGAVAVVPAGTYAKAAVGTPVIVVNVNPSGTHAKGAFGDPAFTFSIAPSGTFAKAVPGSPSVVPGDVTVVPASTFAKAVMGSPMMVYIISPTGHVVKKAFGSPTVVGTAALTDEEILRVMISQIRREITVLGKAVAALAISDNKILAAVLELDKKVKRIGG